MPDNSLLHPPNMYMLELNPTSTQCTHGVAIKLFCRYFYLMIIEPSSMKSKRSRPRDGHSQSELRVHMMLEMSERAEK
jgi:hypothetical protein